MVIIRTKKSFSHRIHISFVGAYFCLEENEFIKEKASFSYKNMSKIYPCRNTLNYFRINLIMWKY